MKFGNRLDIMSIALTGDKICVAMNLRDINGYDIKDVATKNLVDEYDTPDVLFISITCKTYDPQHRRKGSDGYTYPNSEAGAKEDSAIMHMQFMIRDMFLYNPRLLWFMVCPVCELRDAAFMQSASRYTVDDIDVWTNHPDPKFVSGIPLYEQIESMCKVI